MKKKILILILTIMLTITGLVNVNAYDKYDGDYTIEYLLRNYNVVTLGTKPVYNYSLLNKQVTSPGTVTNVFDIGGPVLIRGNYTGNSSYDNEFAQKTNCIPSYIKGRMGPNINPGSIESAELSNIYVGSSNAKENEDGTYSLLGSSNEFNYPIIKSDDYLDFDKLYAAIVNEQKSFSGGVSPKVDVKYSENNYRVTLEISDPGEYNIKNLNDVNRIYFKDYDPNELYIINIEDELIYTFPQIFGINFKSSMDSVYCGRKNSNEICTGNIIWSFPNARYLITAYNMYGHIIAPKADVDLIESHYSGTIIANSIRGEGDDHTAIQFFPYNLDKKITDMESKTTITETLDFNKDLYNGNYSLDELLQNYSVITLGRKEYDSNTKLSTLTNVKGTARIFHIVGQFLISGNLGTNDIVYNENIISAIKGMRFDHKYTDNKASSSINGQIMSSGYSYPYQDYQVLYRYSLPTLYVCPINSVSFNKGYENNYILTGYAKMYNFKVNNNNNNNTLTTKNNVISSASYIDYQVLYDAIVEQQSKIDSGTTLSKDSENKVIVPGNGNYNINNVSDVDTISFIDYETNKKGLTIVTINDSGTIEFPKISTDGVPFTNDYYGGDTILGNSTMQYYEKYIGNIVWNIPNATRIVLPSGSPFVGHVIAPNADLETPETQLAGAMIVNSLYAEGHSELHFYPLNAGSVGTGIELETKTIGEDEPDKITISGTKTWDDKDNQDGVRPDSVTINLLANGEKVDSVEVSEDTDWKYEFNVDRVDSKGVKIVYTITENSIDNYATEIETITDNTCPEGCIGTIVGYNITNSYTPKKTSLTVNKVWNDDNNREGKRPEKVEVQLYADGEKLGDPVELNEDNNWTYIFNDLDMRSKGKDIKYTVERITKLDKYKVEITGNQEEGYTITNTYIKEIKENPTTGDNISKFTIISIISSIILVVGIIVFTKFRRREV